MANTPPNPDSAASGPHSPRNHDLSLGVEPADWAELLKTGPGALWVLPDVETTPPEPAIPIPDWALATAESLDAVVSQLLGAPFDGMTIAIRAHWLATVGPRWCDCPMDPHHRWNCPMTPIWAQTMRDLDTNPWTVVTGAGHRWRAERAATSIQRGADTFDTITREDRQ